MEPCIMNLPHEVLQQILKLVHPKRVTKFKRVCKFWRAVLSDSYFAQLNLKCFAPLGHGSSVDPAPSGAVRCSAPNEFDQLWILLPATYQQFYATSERMQALETIEWYLDCYFIHPIRFRRNPLPIPPAISLLANSLKQLILSSHSFVDKSIYGGEIPLELAHLVHLQVLNLARNSFRGPIQSEIFKRLTRLEELDLSHNKLSGQLPETLFSLKRLRVLNLNANSLEGQIPLEIGALQSLRFLSIESNKLTGTIPASIGKLFALQKLHLGDNLLEDTLPREIGQLLELKDLSIWANKLCGWLPRELYNLRALMFINVSYNRFSGPIRPHIRQLSNLRELDLSYNDFEEELPAELSRLRLRSLYLKGNTKLTISKEIQMNPSFRLMLMREGEVVSRVPDSHGTGVLGTESVAGWISSLFG